VLFMTGNVRWRCWADLLGSVNAGGGGAERTLGMQLFDFYAAHPEESEIHDQAMRGISAAQISAVLAAKDFSMQALWSMSAAVRESCWLQSLQPMPRCAASCSICPMSSRSEFGRLLGDAHFELVKSVPTAAAHSIIEARPI
jgi:hypothetical protein